jgi:lipopolysaccharide export system permease protein
MRGIFFRHALRDIWLSTAAVAAVLLVVLLTYQLAFVLGRAADGQIPAQLVLQLVALSMRSNLSVILPFALLLGTILGLGRLYHDSEIAAAQACGVGVRTLYAATGVVTLVAAGIAAWIGFVDGPTSSRRIAQLRIEALRTAVTRGLAPGQFRSLGFGATLYFQKLDADGTLRDVFVQRQAPTSAGDNGQMEIVLADRARYAVSSDNNFYTIQLSDGESHEGLPGTGNWRVTRFREQTIHVPTPEATLPGKPRVDVLTTAALHASPNPRFKGELHWRISWVVINVVLGMLAVPLARLRPRQGRYARVIWGVLLFAVYAGLLSASRTMLERGDTPPALGLWWVHAVAIALGLALLALPRLSDRWARSRVSTPP